MFASENLGCFCSATWERATRFPCTPGRTVIHQEAFQLQQLVFEVASFTPSERTGIYRLRCALRRRLAQHQQYEVTDALCRFANGLAAAHVDSCPLSLTSKSSQVGLAAWCVTRNLVCVPARDHPPMFGAFRVHQRPIPKLLPLFDPFAFVRFLSPATVLHNLHAAAHNQEHIVLHDPSTTPHPQKKQSNT